jgi:hypothetical protein
MLCIIVGFIAGYITAKSNYNYYRDLDRIHYETCLANSENHYNQTLKDVQKAFSVQIQENAKRQTQMLDEIAHATGIDTVILPSFGTVYLNHTKNVSEAMKAFYDEDLSDGAYD